MSLWKDDSHGAREERVSKGQEGRFAAFATNNDEHGGLSSTIPDHGQTEWSNKHCRERHMREERVNVELPVFSLDPEVKLEVQHFSQLQDPRVLPLWPQAESDSGSDVGSLDYDLEYPEFSSTNPVAAYSQPTKEDTADEATMVQRYNGSAVFQQTEDPDGELGTRDKRIFLEDERLSIMEQHTGTALTPDGHENSWMAKRALQPFDFSYPTSITAAKAQGYSANIRSNGILQGRTDSPGGIGSGLPPGSLLPRPSNSMRSQVSPPPPRPLFHIHGKKRSPAQPPLYNGMASYQCSSARLAVEDGVRTKLMAPRVTRSHCQFRKISLPRDNREDSTRIFFIVPGCSLTRNTVMKDEEVQDHGEVADEETRRMIGDIERLGFDDYLLSVLKSMVGSEAMQQGDIFYLPHTEDIAVDAGFSIQSVPGPDTGIQQLPSMVAPPSQEVSGRRCVNESRVSLELGDVEGKSTSPTGDMETRGPSKSSSHSNKRFRAPNTQDGGASHATRGGTKKRKLDDHSEIRV